MDVTAAPKGHAGDEGMRGVRAGIRAELPRAVPVFERVPAVVAACEALCQGRRTLPAMGHATPVQGLWRHVRAYPALPAGVLRRMRRHAGRRGTRCPAAGAPLRRLWPAYPGPPVPEVPREVAAQAPCADGRGRWRGRRPGLVLMSPLCLGAAGAKKAGHESRPCCPCYIWCCFSRSAPARTPRASAHAGGATHRWPCPA